MESRDRRMDKSSRWLIPLLIVFFPADHSSEWVSKGVKKGREPEPRYFLPLPVNVSVSVYAVRMRVWATCSHYHHCIFPPFHRLCRWIWRERVISSPTVLLLTSQSDGWIINWRWRCFWTWRKGDELTRGAFYSNVNGQVSIVQASCDGTQSGGPEWHLLSLSHFYPKTSSP